MCRSLWILFLVLLNAVFALGQTRRYHFEHPQMGTLFQITLYSSDSLTAFHAAKHAFSRIDTLNSLFSDYDPESELNHLSSQSGKDTCVQVSKELLDIIAVSLLLNEYSDKAFDITIGPMVQLWRRARRKKVLPDRREVRKARKSVGSHYIHIDPNDNCIRLTKEGMRLDLGGIAKGYAVDEALRILKRYGIEQALVDGGGDLVLGEAPPDKEGWEIQLEYVTPNGKLADTLLSRSLCAIATSGDTYRYIEIEGKRYSHIMDPKSGFGLTKRRKVTVIYSNGTSADAWASALSILGPRKWRKRVKKLPQIEVLFLEKRKETYSQVSSLNFFLN